MNSSNKRTPVAVVLGCGLMGADIAAIFSHAGWRVACVEPNRDRWERGQARIATSVSQLGGSFDKAMLSMCATVGAVPWNGVEIVVECAPEDLELKRTVFAELDVVVPPNVLIGSNSSGLPISRITQDCGTAHRMANTHFFLPAHVVPLVEIAQGERTSHETVQRLREIFQQVGRVPVQINQDLPGFLANRMQHALMREAFSIIDRGLATPEDVDAAVRYGFGFRYVAAGPIFQKELAGLDTQLAAASAIYPSLCNDSTPSAGLEQLVQRGHFGTKTLQGYWSWTDGEVDQRRTRYETTLLAAAQLLRMSAVAPPENQGD